MSVLLLSVFHSVGNVDYGSGLTDAKRIRIAINMLIDLPYASDAK